MNGIRVLVVDDNDVNLQLACFLLEAEGFEVFTAAEAKAALEAVDRLRPQLVLTDLYLPGMDGLELTKRIRKSTESSRICIVAVTSCAMPGDKEQSYAAGCDGYLTKPINTRQFASYIRECFLNAHTASSG